MLAAIEDVGHAGILAVVATDLFPELVPLIRSGWVLATINQRPRAKGRLALQALLQFLVEDERPPSATKVPPHIVMMSNLDMFLVR
jgi:ABC-type sugar transport system substrate-binding protein